MGASWATRAMNKHKAFFFDESAWFFFIHIDKRMLPALLIGYSRGPVMVKEATFEANSPKNLFGGPESTIIVPFFRLIGPKRPCHAECTWFFWFILTNKCYKPFQINNSWISSRTEAKFIAKFERNKLGEGRH